MNVGTQLKRLSARLVATVVGLQLAAPLLAFAGPSFTSHFWLTNDSDLPNNKVTALAVAPNGTTWVGTYGGGLARFRDGQWQIFNASNSELPDNGVEAVALAPDGSVWVGTHGGVARFHDGDGQWRIFNTSNSNLPSDDVIAVAAAADGSVWVGTVSGLARFHDGQWTPCDNIITQAPKGFAKALAAAPDGSVWVGGSVGGVRRFYNGDPNIFGKSHCEILGSTVWAIAVAADESVWVGTHGGLARYQMVGDEEPWEIIDLSKSDLPSNSVRSVAVAPDGSVWVGTDGGGVGRFYEDEWTIIDASYSDRPKTVLAVAPAPDGAVWVGTFGDGLARIHERQWLIFDEISDVSSSKFAPIAVGPDGAVWVGMGDGHLGRLHESQWPKLPVGRSFTAINPVQAVSVAPDGTVWVGRSGGGLVGNRRGTKFHQKFIKTSDSELAEDTIQSVAAAPDGTLWVGTKGGKLARFHENKWKTLDLPKSRFRGRAVRAVAVARDGSVWVAAGGVGVLRFQEGGWESFNENNSDLPDNGVQAVAVAPDEAVWIGTVAGGLARFHEGEDQWQIFDKSNSDLPSNNVKGVAVSPDGAVWVRTSGGGLARYRPPNTRSKILEIIGFKPEVNFSPEEHTGQVFAVRAFDPSLTTRPGEFEFRWTLKFLDWTSKRDGLKERVWRTGLPFFEVDYANDGKYRLTVVAFDRNGYPSDPYPNDPEDGEFVVALPVPPPDSWVLRTWAAFLKWHKGLLPGELALLWGVGSPTSLITLLNIILGGLWLVSPSRLCVWAMEDLSSAGTQPPFKVASRWLTLVAWLGTTQRALDRWIRVNREELLEACFTRDEATKIKLGWYVDLGHEDAVQEWRNSVRGGQPSAVWIHGPGGCGKSMLALHMAAESLAVTKRRPFVPILIDQNWSDDFLDFVRRLMRMEGRGSRVRRPTPGMVRKLAVTGRFMFIFDGLSERQVPSAVESVHRLREDAFRHVVVTSRQPCDRDTGFESVRLGSLTDASRIGAFVGKYQPDAERALGFSASIEGFRKGKPVQPLFARMLITRLQHDEKLPGGYAALVEDYVLEIRPKGGGSLKKGSFLDAARSISFFCVKDNYAPRDMVEDAVNGWLERAAEATPFLSKNGKPVSPGGIIEQLVDCGLLVRSINLARTRLRFAEDPIAEYLAAMEIAGWKDRTRATQFKARVDAAGPEAQGLRDALAEIEEL